MVRTWRLFRVWRAYRRYQRELAARWDRLADVERDELRARTALYPTSVDRRIREILRDAGWPGSTTIFSGDVKVTRDDA